MFKRNKKSRHHLMLGNKRMSFCPSEKKRPSRKKRLLIGTAFALGALGIAGQIEKGRDS